MSFEIVFTTCQQCGITFYKRVNESRKRREDRKFCSTKCAKDYLRIHELGWFSYGANTIKKKKETIDDIAPVIWEKRDFDQFEKDYPELASFA